MKQKYSLLQRTLLTKESFGEVTVPRSLWSEREIWRHESIDDEPVVCVYYAIFIMTDKMLPFFNL